jgi:NAD(P)-dependent dehydrogenase (short-subunit alcohol dehydrogenase family)
MVKQMHAGRTKEPYCDTRPMRRYGSPEDIAHAVGFLASNEAGFITGDTLAVDGGFLASGLFVRDLLDDAFKMPPVKPLQPALG